MQDVAPIPPSKAPSATNQPKSLRVTPKMRAALDLMVWENLTDNQAAVKMKMTVHAIRIALKLPHVRAYFKQQMEVLRERENPRNIHALINVRDAGTNQMATVAAVNALMKQDNQQPAGTAATSPGVVIQIIGNASLMAHERQIDTNLLISNEAVHDEQ